MNQPTEIAAAEAAKLIGVDLIFAASRSGANGRDSHSKDRKYNGYFTSHQQR